MTHPPVLLNCAAYLFIRTVKVSVALNALSLVQEDGREVQLPPQERVAAVRPFWETLTQEQRVELLSISVDELRTRAKDVVARLRKQAGEYCTECNVLMTSGCNDPCTPAGSDQGSVEMKLQSVGVVRLEIIKGHV